MPKPISDSVAETTAVAVSAAPQEAATDVELVARVRAGDEAAFEQLFERHRRRVARVAGRFFRQPEKIEDVIQETFIKVYFNLNSYTGEGAFGAWLATIAANAARDELRRQARHPTSALSELSEAEADWIGAHLKSQHPADDLERTLVARDLATKLLDRLEPDDRFVLTLINAEELSVEEVAELTGWSKAKVKMRAFRARNALRRVLKKFL